MTLLNPPEYDGVAERRRQHQIKTFTLLCGSVGLAVAIVLNIISSSELSTSTLFILWPSSIFGFGFNGPSLSLLGLIIAAIEYGGNFVLYGLVGFLLSASYVWLRRKR
jgi:hypothetical protein